MLLQMTLFHCFYGWTIFHCGLPSWLSSKESTCQCRRCRQETWVQYLCWEDPLKYTFQYSFLENSIDRKVWCTAVCGVAKSWTWLSAHIHTIKVKVKLLSHVWLFVTPWNVAYQAPLSMRFSRQVYWSGLPFPSPGDLSNSGIKLCSPTLQADALPSEPLVKQFIYTIFHCVHHVFFFHTSSVSEHLGCFPVLAIVNCAVINIGVHESFQTMVFSRHIYAQEWDCWITW